MQIQTQIKDFFGQPKHYILGSDIDIFHTRWTFHGPNNQFL